jgi:hypothetical protein
VSGRVCLVGSGPCSEKSQNALEAFPTISCVDTRKAPRTHSADKNEVHPPAMQRTALLLWLPYAVRGMSTVARSPLRTRLLGSSSIRVTEACLGTMTWGTQNCEMEAHAQVHDSDLRPSPFASPIHHV